MFLSVTDVVEFIVSAVPVDDEVVVRFLSIMSLVFPVTPCIVMALARPVVAVAAGIVCAVPEMVPEKLIVNGKPVFQQAFTPSEIELNGFAFVPTRSLADEEGALMSAARPLEPATYMSAPIHFFRSPVRVHEVSL